MKKKVKNNYFYNDNNSGFTLIELAIVIIITGFLFIPLIRAYSTYETEKRIVDTQEAVSLSSSLVAKHGGTFTPTAYPCPADASLLPTDANFGIAQCAALAALPINSCNVSGGLCRVAGARLIGTPPVVKSVYIGGMPINTMRLVVGDEISFSNEDVIDAWGNRIMYAVSAELTVGVTYKYYNGVIGATDEFGNPTAGVDNDAHYVVFSPGQDKRGGFNEFGVRSFVCNLPANSRDFENCDGDATFVQAKGYYLGAGNTYYDDHIFFGREFAQAIWVYETDLINIRTEVTGNVGVGTDTPGTKLDIQDPVNAELRADNSIFVKTICNKAGTDCFDIDSITGTGKIRCPAASDVMVGISLENEDCIPPVYAPPIAKDCGVGKWVHGFKTNGDVICFP